MGAFVPKTNSFHLSVKVDFVSDPRSVEGGSKVEDVAPLIRRPLMTGYDGSS